ncbi:MAG: hypothetical protein AB7L65_08010 [Hyphomonadaceae bacterium]
MNTAMNMTRFKAILDAYGAAPRRWPEAERAAAEAFAAAHEECAALLAEARALDGVLDAMEPHAPSELLFARVMRKAPKPALIARAAWKPAAALAACAIFGVVLGFGGGALAPQSADATDTMISAALQGADADNNWLGEEG